MKKVLILLTIISILAAPVSALSGTVATESTSLNVRSAASTSSSVIGSLAKGSTVTLLSKASDGWWAISYSGQTAYASALYIDVNSTSSASYYSYIGLSLPDYRQYDSRWGSVRLGNSTIASIGCTVTSLAMAETYRLGYTVTPANIVSSYSFTSGGAIYWKNGYTSSYPSDYLSFIYNKLEDGVPVLVHSRKTNGTAHWVVVCGFKGGELTASNFIIRDPASDYRTTLASYFAVYPNFVKCVSR